MINWEKQHFARVWFKIEKIELILIIECFRVPNTKKLSLLTLHYKCIVNYYRNRFHIVFKKIFFTISSILKDHSYSHLTFYRLAVVPLLSQQEVRTKRVLFRGGGRYRIFSQGCLNTKLKKYWGCYCCTYSCFLVKCQKFRVI